ncbi:uncharacterized protein (DUF2249 family) [Pedobacter sp. CAN_A7]|uniref:DUF2249 domain-containing protein n=1 Tax=Pedobacter sp. CAN_A7 TaxID=2787722 RepID=UPI0018C959EC
MKAAHLIPIHSGTRIKILLDANKHGVIEALVKLNSNFAKLKNPVLRSLFASRVTIADACRIARCKEEDFLHSMRQLGFQTTLTPPEPSLSSGKKTFDFNRPVPVFELDARSYLAQDQDPLKAILAIVNKMAPGERFKLTNSFEPIPLISLLTEKGFSYDVEYIKEDLVVTWFEKHDTTRVVAAASLVPADEADQQVFNRVLAKFIPAQIIYIDVRDLEMPQPMLLILSNIDKLPSGGLLYVYHKKVPVFLLPELEKRGMGFSLYHRSATAVDMLIYRS